MSIREQLVADMKDAMRARDAVTLGTIRYLLAQIKNVEIDSGPQDDAQVIEIIRKQIKQTKESIEEYQKGNREDLVSDESAKLAVLQKYVPQGMNRTDLVTVASEVIAENPGMPMGQLIGAVKAKTAGRAEGSEIAAVVRELLTQ